MKSEVLRRVWLFAIWYYPQGNVALPRNPRLVSSIAPSVHRGDPGTSSPTTAAPVPSSSTNAPTPASNLSHPPTNAPTTLPPTTNAPTPTYHTSPPSLAPATAAPATQSPTIAPVVPTPETTAPIVTEAPQTKSPSAPPSSTPSAHPVPKKKHISFWRIIGKTIAWLIIILLSVVAFGAFMSHRYRIYYYARTAWYTLCRLDCTVWLLSKIPFRSSSAVNDSLNTIIFDNEMNEGLLMRENVD
jgi:hypothetical protein